MSGNTIHYEVLGQRGSTWTILAVIDDQDEAIEVAKGHRINYRAVKVMRERYDAKSNVYRSGQIFFSGAKPKPSKYDNSNLGTVCWKVEDFYSYEGRRSINRLLRNELIKWGITATELVHSISDVDRLLDDGTALQRAVQQAAIAQVRETGQGVQERIKQIFELIDRGIDKLRRDKEAAQKLKIGSGGIDSVLAEIAPKESRIYLLNVALAQSLSKMTGFGEKLSYVVGLVRDDHPAWVHEVADTFVGELLSVGNVVNRLIGERPSLRDELAVSANLALGRLDPSDELVRPEALVVSDRIASGLMPWTRQALEQHLIEQLRSTRPLSDGDLLAESSAAHHIMEQLTLPDGSWLGDTRMVEAAGNRCSRWLHPEAIAEYLAPVQEPNDRANRLLDLEPHVIGNANKRKLAEYLAPVLTSPQSEISLTSDELPIPQRLQRIARLQHRILGTDLPEMNVRQLSERLDELAHRLVHKAKLFERLLASKSSMPEKCVGLVRMILDGYFTHGKVADEARDIVRRMLVTSEFRNAFAEPSVSKEERIQKFEELANMLRAAKIEGNDSEDPRLAPSGSRAASVS